MLSGSYDITFAICIPSDSLIKVIANEGFKLIKLKETSYIEFFDGFSNECKYDLEQLGAFDAVILDGYSFGTTYQKAVLNAGMKCVIIEDNGQGSYQVDMVINHAPGLTPNNYFVDNPNCLFALGPQYALLRTEFLESAKVQFPLREGTGKVFVYFGGADLKQLTTTTCKLLLENTSLDVVTIVNEKNEQYQDIFDLSQAFKQRLILKPELSASQMLTEMRETELAIVPCSGILFECMAAQIKVISGVTIENQLNVYKGFKQMNVFIDAENFNEAALLSSIRKSHCSVLSKSPIDGKSPERYLSLFQMMLN